MIVYRVQLIVRDGRGGEERGRVAVVAAGEEVGPVH